MRSAGFAAETFASAEDFLGSASLIVTACLVLDIHLNGGMTGFELQTQLKVDGVVIPIIFITADDEASMRERVHASGAAGYLSKPFDDHLLIEAIRSILDQTFGDFELIFIDDASTDDSVAIADSFGDPRVVVLSNEEQLGITGTLNRGIAAARGALIARMDADDVAQPERFARQQEHLLGRPGPAIVGSNVVLIDRDGVEIGTERHPSSARDIRRTILVHNPFAHGTVMLTRSLLERHGVYDRSFLHNEDYDLWLRLAAAGSDMANLDAFLLRRRIHDRNITVARQREMVGYRCRTLAHAVFHYYRNPLLAVHLVRPAAAYLYRSVR